MLHIEDQRIGGCNFNGVSNRWIVDDRIEFNDMLVEQIVEQCPIGIKDLH